METTLDPETRPDREPPKRVWHSSTAVEEQKTTVLPSVTDRSSLSNSESSPGRISRDGAAMTSKPSSSASFTESLSLLDGRVKPMVVMPGHPASP